MCEHSENLRELAACLRPSWAKVVRRAADELDRLYEGASVSKEPMYALVATYANLVGKHGPDSEETRWFRMFHGGNGELLEYADALDRIKRNLSGQAQPSKPGPDTIVGKLVELRRRYKVSGVSIPSDCDDLFDELVAEIDRLRSEQTVDPGTSVNQCPICDGVGSDRGAIEREVNGAILSAISAHGPITASAAPSAAKRVIGILKAITRKSQPKDPDVVDKPVTWRKGGAFGAKWPFEGYASPGMLTHRYKGSSVTIIAYISRTLWPEVLAYADPADLEPPTWEDARC